MHQQSSPSAPADQIEESKFCSMAATFSQLVVFYILRGIRVYIDFLTDLIFPLLYRKKRIPLPPVRDPIILETALALAAKIRNQQVTSERVVQAFIERIRDVDPIINAVVDERYEAALQEARQIDADIASGKIDLSNAAETKPFLGIPFTCKDAIMVKGLRQTAGLLARKDAISDDDAPVIKQMRAAGGIPLCVTNISELCMWWESYNRIYGRSNNPYDSTRIVGGSSGGEGALLAAAGSVIGVGSDIGGSIRIPSFFNGIFGHKPSAEIVSNEGQQPVAHGAHQYYLTTGPMCRYTTDLVVMYKILSEPNAAKLRLTEPVDVKKLKYYYMENDGGNPLISSVHPEMKAALKKVVTYLESAYNIKVQPLKVKEMFHSLEMWSTKMNSSDSPSFCALLANHNGEINPWFELVRWIFRMSKHTLPAIGLGMLERISPSAESERAEKVLQRFERLKETLVDALGTDGVLFYPPHPRPAPYHNQPLYQPFNFSYTSIFNTLGFPVTQCPMGLSSDGLPLGVQVIANINNDHLTLALATELEKAFGGWVNPSLPS